MSHIDFVRRFYSHDRLSPEGRAALLDMFHDDVHYIGVGKVTTHGRPALERLFAESIARVRGVTAVKFDIRHIAENGNAVLVDMVDTFTINGKDVIAVMSIVFEIENDKIVFWQEHYPVGTIEQAKRDGA
jgi:limonene-1,2-epoxide hydrolase